MEKQKEKRLALGTRLAYGSGDTACNIVFGMTTALLTLFYTDYAGVPVAIVGLVMLVSRVFDGVSDLIMGFIVNKTNSRWGKARPWILWMAIPYCVCAVLLFTVPQSTTTVQFWYMLITYNLCTTVCYTAINVPYGTLSTLMTKSSHERDLLSIFRMAMAPLGRMVAVSLTLPLVKRLGDTQAAWVKATMLWVVLAFILLVICFAKCKETVVYEEAERSKVSMGQNLKALASNQYFWATLILWTVTCVHSTIVGTVMPYYCKYIYLNSDWAYSVLYFAETLVLVGGAMLCPLFLRRVGKRNISLAGCILAIVAQAAFLLNPYSYAWALTTTIIRSLGIAPLIALVFGMMGDTVEFGYWKTGVRQEALVFGAGSLGFKFGTGITSAIITSLLSYAGYLSSSDDTVLTQPQSALDMVRGIYSWGIILVWVIALIVLVLYKLDKNYKKITAEIEERDAAKQLAQE